MILTRNLSFPIFSFISKVLRLIVKKDEDMTNVKMHEHTASGRAVVAKQAFGSS